MIQKLKPRVEHCQIKVFLSLCKGIRQGLFYFSPHLYTNTHSFSAGAATNAAEPSLELLCTQVILHFWVPCKIRLSQMHSIIKACFSLQTTGGGFILFPQLIFRNTSFLITALLWSFKAFVSWLISIFCTKELFHIARRKSL